jgi:rRNA maturation endonuclease Nob1
MWSLLQEKTGITEAELEERVKLLDTMDGVADGKATRTAPQTCTGCGRPWSAQHQRCLYCGGTQAAGSVFDRV